MRRLFDKLELAIGAVLVLVLGTMLVVGSMQIIWRYVLHAALSWSEELMRFMYVWATMLGVPIAIRRKSFAAIDTLLDFVGARSEIGRKIFTTVSFVVQLLVFAVFIIYGTKLTIMSGGQRSPAMMLEMKWIYLSFPVGGVLSFICSCETYWRSLTEKKTVAKKEVA